MFSLSELTVRVHSEGMGKGAYGLMSSMSLWLITFSCGMPFSSAKTLPFSTMAARLPKYFTNSGMDCLYRDVILSTVLEGAELQALCGNSRACEENCGWMEMRKNLLMGTMKSVGSFNLLEKAQQLTWFISELHTDCYRISPLIQSWIGSAYPWAIS